jgi:hypothetical protein
MELGWGGGDAFGGVEDDAEVAVAVRDGDWGAAKLPGWGWGWGWGWGAGGAGRLEDDNLCLGQVDVKLGGGAEGVQGVQLTLQAGRGGAEEGEVISVEQEGDGQAGQCWGGGVGGGDERGHAVNVQTEEQGAEGAALLDAKLAGEGGGVRPVGVEARAVTQE